MSRGFVKWEQGYCALTYSEAEKEHVVQYILNQKEHHRRVSARDELIALLTPLSRLPNSTRSKYPTVDVATMGFPSKDWDSEPLWR